MSRYKTAFTLVACATAFATASAFAQEAFPSKPIQFIVPTGPGGGTDTVARLIARHLGERLKWQVVVINRLGAGTRMASESIAKAAPDGYSLLMGINAMATGSLVYKSLPYDVQRDFTPVTLALVVPYLFVIHPSLPLKSPKDLIALAKALPGRNLLRLGRHRRLQSFVVRTPCRHGAGKTASRAVQIRHPGCGRCNGRSHHDRDDDHGDDQREARCSRT